MEELSIPRDSLELIDESKLPLRFIFKTPKIKNGVEIIGSERYFFGFRFIGNDDEIKPQEDEVRAYKWVSFSDLGKYLLFDGQLEDSVGKTMEIFPGFKKNEVRNKYNSLTNIPDAFTKNEWELAVSVIDFLPYDTLVKLNTEYEIMFEGGNKNTDSETLVFGLFNHLNKEQIMEIAYNYLD